MAALCYFNSLMLAKFTENYYDLLDTGGRVSTSGRVYIALTTDLRESCVEVMAVEDEKLEWSRSFIVKMENADPSVLNTFNSNQVTVLITDNDGEYCRLGNSAVWDIGSGTA